jgi:GNAT superfamily N-acetyltransferase
MLTIREATIDDLAAITLLLHDLGYPATESEVKIRFENIGRHEDYRTLVAVSDGTIAGMIGMTKNYYFEHNGQYIRILVMVVGNLFRNKGIGKMLITEAEKWARAINAHTVLLNSGNRPERQDAYRFYQNIGFEIKSSGFVKKIEY